MISIDRKRPFKMTNEHPSTIEYIMGLDPKQMKEALEALPPEQKSILINKLCKNVNDAVSVVLNNKEQIWANR